MYRDLTRPTTHTLLVMLFRHIKKIKQKEQLQWTDYASLGVTFGLILSLPLVILIPAGVYLDKKIGTLPAFILASFFVALAFSSLMLYRVISDVLRRE